MKYHSVLLIGSGQLGSRYLQGLVAYEHPLLITVTDPHQPSLALAKQRLSEVNYSHLHEIQFIHSLDDAPDHQYDLALLLTPAHCRARLVSEIAIHHEVRSWVLEKLLAQGPEQLDEIVLALEDNSQVWVNTPRRLMSWHHAIRSQILFDNNDLYRVCVSGGSWGLACNAIHFIDLVAWWNQSPIQSINSSGLCEWFPSKRAGFYEVAGSLNVHFANGCELDLRCCSGTDPIQIKVVTSKGEWLIDESTGRAVGPAGQLVSGQITYQSEITAPLVKQILVENHCNLPTLSESVAQHRFLLSSFLNHWNQSQGCDDSIVPIT